MDERLRNEIKRVVRREMRTSRDFTWLSNKVWERVHERLSPTTLKRFFGYLDEGVSPSQFTPQPAVSPRFRMLSCQSSCRCAVVRANIGIVSPFPITFNWQRV